ncbi:MAG: T9SS type A sorting domain-containing protein [Bacteroidia bacterium]|nr:T9SS type A sorting domain-containing protein [Bacteroidia bacterium]
MVAFHFGSELTFAQKALFQEVNVQSFTLKSTESNSLSKIATHKSVRRVRLLRLNKRVISQNTQKLYLLQNSRINARHLKTIKRGDNNYSWFGQLEDGTGVFFTIKNGKIASKFYMGDTPCLLSPLGDDYYALIEYSSGASNHLSCLTSALQNQTKMNGHIEKESQVTTLSSTTNDNNCNLRVLVVVTQAAESEITATGMGLGHFVQMAIDETNLAYLQSQVNFEMELGRIVRTSYVEVDQINTINGLLVDLERFQAGTSPLNQAVAFRETYDTDVQILIRRAHPTLYGQAFEIPVGSTQPSANNAFCVVTVPGITFGRFTFAHEVAHLQGARHDDDNRTPSYARGYVLNNSSLSIRTIMALGCSQNNGCRIQFFSNPNVTFNGQPVGTTDRNNARRLNETSIVVRNHRTTRDALIIGNDLISSGIIANYLSKNTITTNGSISYTNGSEVTMRTGISIDLMPGFQALNGAEFTAYVEGNACQDLPELMSLQYPGEDLIPSFISPIETSTSKKELTISPNPARLETILNLETTDVANEIVVEVYDQIGFLVYKNVFDRNQGIHNLKIPLENLNSGIYTFHIKVNGSLEIKKVVVW